MPRREDYDIVLRATDQTQQAFNSAKRGAEGLTGAVGSLRTGFGALAAIIAGSEISSAIHGAVESFAKIGAQAKIVGVTTDALQALRFEARQSGGEFTDADTALEKFARAASQAGSGTNYLAKVFQANRVSLRDSNGELRSATDLLGDFARLVANAGSQQDKVRLAVEAFGKNAGPQMVEVLERISRQGLQGVISNAQQLGVVADKELIKKAEEFDKKWKQASDTLSTYFKSAVVSATEAVNKFFDATSRQPNKQIADALRDGTYTFQQLQTAISMARKAGSPIDPSWLKDFERLAELERERNRATGYQKILPEAPTFIPNEAMETAITAIKKRNEALLAESTVIDRAAGVQETLKVRTELLTTAQQQGSGIAQQYGKQINEIARGAGAAADAMAAAKIKSIFFERSQLGRTGIEQTVSEKLRSAKIDANSATGQQIASEIRLNEVLKDTKSLADDALKGLVADFRAGKSGAELMSGVLDKIITKLSNLAIDNLTSALFKPASDTTGGVGILGSLGKLFGFAEGGEFRVGGIGGTDSQLVAFRASPDETVRVSRPGSSRGDGGNNVQINIVNNAPGTDVRPSSRRQGDIDIHDIIVSTVNDGMANGRFDQALKARHGLALRPRPR